MTQPPTLILTGLPGIPNVQPGDDLATLIAASLTRADITLVPGDVLVVTSKLVSKVENRFVNLHTVTPSPRAQRVAALTRKDPRLVELVLAESTEIARLRGEVLIVRHRLGFTLANAGIDHSNLGRGKSGEWVLLLPEDPDRSARELRADLGTQTGVEPGIVISDSHGRPFRMGTINFAIGLAGFPAIWDQRGDVDLFGRTLEVTQTGLGDELAAAAGLVSGQAAQGLPVVHIRGAYLPAGDGQAADLVRPVDLDLYHHVQEVDSQSS
ncbi:MAG: coenzyme F420-0:L-glutamate ligase [Chloroflexi bacterium]|nr:coenzyme F420-0:L-glutamate ligase [Chloroflexota bacterium]